MASHDDSLNALESLGVAKVFTDSYQTKSLPLHLDIYFGPPEEFFNAVDTQDAYTHGELVPLLDDGNFGQILFLDPNNQRFVLKDVESPNEDQRVFETWQQYLADLLRRIEDSGVESQDWSRLPNW